MTSVLNGVSMTSSNRMAPTLSSTHAWLVSPKLDMMPAPTTEVVHLLSKPKFHEIPIQPLQTQHRLRRSGFGECHANLTETVHERRKIRVHQGWDVPKRVVKHVRLFDVINWSGLRTTWRCKTFWPPTAQKLSTESNPAPPSTTILCSPSIGLMAAIRGRDRVRNPPWRANTPNRRRGLPSRLAFGVGTLAPRLVVRGRILVPMLQQSLGHVMKYTTRPRDSILSEWGQINALPSE